MARTITVETALLTDAVNRAARIAPSKGAAYDKAQGIQIEVRPGTNAPVRVLATDLDTTFWTRLRAESMGDEAADWRLNAALISGFLTNLPLTAGRTVTLTEEGGQLVIKSGRSRAKLRRIPDSLPQFPLFNPDGMSRSTNFGTRVARVSWAVHTDQAPFCGVHITGTELIACDRHRMAFLPCDVPVEAPVTAPMSKLSPLLKNTLDVRLRATDTRLQIMPDDDTQMTCALIAEPYPNVRNLLRFDVPHAFTLDKQTVTAALNRMLVLVKTERYPTLFVSIADNVMTLRMHVEELGEMVDEIAVAGPDLEAEFALTPQNLRDAVSNAGRDSITMHISGDARKPMRFTDDSDYDAWITPKLVAGVGGVVVDVAA